VCLGCELSVPDVYWTYSDGCPGTVTRCTRVYHLGYVCDRPDSVPQITDKGTRVSAEVYSGVLGL